MLLPQNDAVTRRIIELEEIEQERKRQANKAQMRLQDIIDKTECVAMRARCVAGGVAAAHATCVVSRHTRYLAEELNNGEWDERERARIAASVVAQTTGDGTGRFRLVDEIEIVRRQRYVLGVRVRHGHSVRCHPDVALAARRPVDTSSRPRRLHGCTRSTRTAWHWRTRSVRW